MSQNMALAKHLTLFIFLNILKNGKAEENKDISNVQHGGNINDAWHNSIFQLYMPLKYNQQIIKNVYIRKGYDVENPTNDIFETATLTRVSYQILRFYVGTLDEWKKKLTVHIRMKGTWVDSRIRVNLSGTDKNIILLPTTKIGNPPILWNPFDLLKIYEMINKKNNLYPIQINFLKLTLQDSWPRKELSSQNVFVSADIDWRVTVSCNSLVDYSNFPHDSHMCRFKMRSNYVNATLEVKGKKREMFKRNFKYEELSGFTLSNSIFPTECKYTGEKEFKYSMFGVEIKLVRRLEKYILESYVPCTLIVLASILSFIIPLSAIPGRVGLVVTLFLTLTHMFLSQRVRNR